MTTFTTMSEAWCAFAEAATKVALEHGCTIDVQLGCFAAGERSQQATCRLRLEAQHGDYRTTLLVAEEQLSAGIDAYRAVLDLTRRIRERQSADEVCHCGAPASDHDGLKACNYFTPMPKPGDV